MSTLVPSVRARFDNAFSSPVWANVCGLSPDLLPQWGLLVLRFIAYDSSQNKPPVYVLGGYLAHVADWAEFSIDWGHALKADPAIRRLKTSFVRQDLKDNAIANAKLNLLYSVIEKHIKYAAAVAIDPRIVRSVFDKRDKMSSHPFYAIASILITDVARLIRETGISYSGIEFVFDDQMKEKGRFLDAWQFAQRKMSGVQNPDIQKILKNTPKFENDESCLPIQAADMLVWRVRRMLHQQLVPNDISPLYWKMNDKVLYRFHTIDEEGLRARKNACRN